MFNAITITTVWVLDQDEALDFYVGKLGFQVDEDVDLGFMRWLTIALPSDPGRNLLPEVPGPPAMSEETAAQLRDLLTKGALGTAAILTTDDCQGVYDKLKASGIEFTQDVEQQPYGLDCAFRDPFGNQVRVTQPVKGPIEITEADIARWGGKS
ncbi:VOC family protein [Dactylosporangium sp. CS-033363]|uniref:VOC family protein n=1 Tax=Dactylosporangium sp. CS-033363 TaxID=3239935 RepID=UPI003D91250E